MIDTQPGEIDDNQTTSEAEVAEPSQPSDEIITLTDSNTISYPVILQGFSSLIANINLLARSERLHPITILDS